MKVTIHVKPTAASISKARDILDKLEDQMVANLPKRGGDSLWDHIDGAAQRVASWSKRKKAMCGQQDDA